MGSVTLPGLGLSEKAQSLMAESIVWDNHMCMPLRPEDESFLPELQRLKDSGVDAVSLNIGFDVMPWENSVLTISTMRRWLRQHADKYILVEKADDVLRAKAEGKVAVMFDIEGGVSLNDHLPMIELYYDLGVRWMLFAYNLNNSLAGGCQDDNMGLTDFGRQVVREMERVGMVICCTHTSHQATMEIMEMAKNPVIFSHSNPKVYKDHYRNVQDEAIKACAKTGGVICINGIGDFLGENDASTEAIVKHIDYAVQLVGSEHVGIGTDYVFDQQELEDFLKNNPKVFDPEKYSGGMAMVKPEQYPEIAESLVKLGYADQDIKNILGENLLRVARAVWK